ncbi:RDD family protein [Embleya sp. NBC_00896]|uniref:RDD family protein n=1 Tax=Embleya sp. NBC_00896 TaxID=2975961 RepID=UPI002F916763|nr:RDD family protein [Embleya sp. NBC_00896]
MFGGALWRRLGARFVDYLLVMVPTVALGWAAVPLVQRMVSAQAQQVGRRTRARIISSGVDADVLRDTARDSAETMSKTASAFVIALLVVAMVLWFLYDWFAHAVFGRTLGKVVFGLEVVRGSGWGRPGLVRSLARTAVLIGVPTVLLCYAWAYTLAERPDRPTAFHAASWAAAGGLAIAVLPGNRALHDWLSFTRVETTR